MIILYDNVCTPCVRKTLWRDLQSKCNKNNQSLKRVDISKDVSARQESLNRYNATTPFIVLEDGYTMSLQDYLYG